MTDQEKPWVKGYTYPAIPVRPEEKAFHDKFSAYAEQVLVTQEINEAVARKLGWKPNERLRHVLAVQFPPNYCHDMAAAWEIVESLDMTTYINCPAVGGKKWHVAFGDQGWTEDNSAPMAICLAFLKLEGK